MEQETGASVVGGSKAGGVARAQSVCPGHSVGSPTGGSA